MEAKEKKRFSLMESLVVIAILVILLIIGVLGYGLFNQKTHILSDEALITQWNKFLNEKEDLHQGIVPTAQEALDIIYDEGYIGDVIKTSTEGYHFAYDLEVGKFVLIDNNGNKTFPEDVIWNSDNIEERKANTVLLLSDIKEFTNGMNTESVEFTSPFGIYLGRNISEDFSEKTIIVHKAFDAGERNDVRNVKYENNVDQDVTIRTNGNNLLIYDISKGSIKHYGVADYVNVVQCHTASYHEFGKVAIINIRKGHIAFEKGAVVNNVHIEKSDKEVVNNKTYDKFDTIILSFADGVKQPQFSRDEVNINPNGTKVCTLAIHGETNNIYLLLNGIYEQIKIENADENGNAISEQEWVSTSSVTLDTKIAADQLANNYGGRTSAIGNELDSGVIDSITREFINKKYEENVVETGMDSKTASIIAVGVKAYFKELTNAIEIDLIDFTNVAKENGKTINGKYDLSKLTKPNVAKLDKAFSFKAFENKNDELAIEELFTYMNIIDDSQLKDLTLRDIENAINNASSTRIDKQRLLALIDVRKDYLDWNVDFTISFNKDVKANSVVLGGQYDNYSDSWVGFGLPFNVVKNEEVRMLQSAYKATNNAVFRMNYAAICGWVKEFNCGIANLAKENVGVKATITLKIYEAFNGVETGKEIEISTVTVTFDKYQLNY